MKAETRTITLYSNVVPYNEATFVNIPFETIHWEASRRYIKFGNERLCVEINYGINDTIIVSEEK